MRNAVFLIVTALLLAKGGVSQTIEPSRVKVRLVFPVTHWSTPDVAWIDIYACAQPRRLCDQWIERIQLFDIKGAGRFSYKYDSLGSVALLYTGGDASNPVWIATQHYTQHWYPPVELCQAEGKLPRCRYRVQRDVATKSLSVKLLMENS